MFLFLSIVLWTSFASVFYSYVGFPLLMFFASKAVDLWTRAKRQSTKSVESAESELPSVTVLIAAHNAGRQIQDRIENLLACDYPAELLQILVASDGSTDETVNLVRALELPNVNVLPFLERRGKASTLVAAVQHVQSEVVVFTDASTVFHKAAIRRLSGHFSDPEMGIVAGKVSILDEFGRKAESLYWRSEMMVRRAEVKLGIMMGASGAIYAMRRKLFVAPTGPIINDDLVFPILTHLKHKCKFTLDETAQASAINCGGLRTEFKRRSRIGAGGFQSLPELRGLFRFQHLHQASVFVSHKLLRWVCPFLLILMLVCNVGLLMAPGYGPFMWMQLAAYSLAIVGIFTPSQARFASVPRIASSFLLMNLAVLTGFFQWLSDANRVVWNPTPRTALGKVNID